MRQIDIKKQPRMSLPKIFGLTINGIRYRLFRSVVTMLVITVAIAFLMNSLSASLIKRRMSRVARERIRSQRLATQWVARLTLPGTVEEIIRRSADRNPKSAWYRESRELAGWSAAEMDAYAKNCRAAAGYLDFFAAMSYDDRRQLVHTSTGIGVFSRLQDPADWQKFETRLAELLNVRLKTGVDDFRDFIREWPALKAKTLEIQQARSMAVKAAAAVIGDRSPMQTLAQQGGEFVQGVKAAGFMFAADEAAMVKSQAKELMLHRILEERLNKLPVRQRISARLNTTPEKISSTTLWRRLLKSPDEANWTLRLMNLQWALEKGLADEAVRAALAEHTAKPAADLELDTLLKRMLREEEFADWFLAAPAVQALNARIDLTPEDAVAIAARKREIAKFLEADRLSADIGGGFFGLGSRMSWLLLVSMIVCTVGIANAMLMSVTERFREIATLKCLGALDGFIMIMFVIEACILGLCGGILGAIGGTLIGIFRMRLHFGWVVWSAVGAQELLIGLAVAIFVGVVLAAVAAVYPSLQASRLAPMEAMRIE